MTRIQRRRGAAFGDVAEDGAGGAVSTRDVFVGPQHGSPAAGTDTLAQLGGVTMQVAHDLRGYLSAIRTLVATLDCSLEPEHPGREAVHELLLTATAATAVTSQLLDAGRAVPAPAEALDLGEAVAASEPLLRSVLGPEFSLEIQREAEPCRVRMHRHRLEQLLMNLVANAAAAEPEDGRVTVGVRCVGTRGARHVELRVSDRGCGMDESLRRRAPLPYFTTRVDQGSGLGLVIVDAVAREAGGQVRIDSRCGKGTTVTIRLPAA